MSREVHRIVRNPQYVDRCCQLAANPEQDYMPSTRPDMQRAQPGTDLIALSHLGYNRSALQPGE